MHTFYFSMGQNRPLWEARIKETYIMLAVVVSSQQLQNLTKWDKNRPLWEARIRETYIMLAVVVCSRQLQNLTK